MKRKITLILSAICVIALSMGLAACGKTETPRDKLEKEGYKIFVTYDTNNGDFMGRKTLVDAFKPESFAKDADGKIHIKLLDPDDAKRVGDTQLSPSLSQYFYVGWYRTREVVRNDDGAALDDNGNVILEDDEGFYVLDSENKRVAVRPAYTYSGRWDFDTDTVEYSDDEDIKDLRLYAAWVPYFEFRYYYEQGNEWVYYGSTNFDYKTTNAADSATFDYDMLWVPKWSDAGDTGYMNHDHVKADSKIYTFPSVAGKTFNSAYLDEGKNNKITDSFEHDGTIDYEHGVAVGRIKNIYTVCDEGRNYRITTADQLIANANEEGNYEIYNDLDFTDKKWPVAFMSGEFKGSMFGKDGKTVKLSNINAEFVYKSSNGGLFGTIKRGAKFMNVTFENVVMNLRQTEYIPNSNFGFFAGYIEDEYTGEDKDKDAAKNKVTIENVTVGGTFRIGPDVRLRNGYSLNLIANGDRSGITVTEVILQFYGQKKPEREAWGFICDPELVTVEEDYNIVIQRITSTEKGYETFNVNLTEVK